MAVATCWHMNTGLFPQSIRQGFTAALAGLALLLTHQASAKETASAAELLEKGIYTEETKGQIKDAAALYQQIVEDPRADRSLVAQAQLRLGLCQLKLGNKPQAIAALDRLTQEFPDKGKLLGIVGQHMPQVLEEIVGQIERNYLLEVDRGELLETAIRAIVGKLDSQGGLLRTNDLEFLSAGQMKEFNVQLNQKIAGIGVVLKAEGEELVLQSSIPGSPAFEGGLRAGDRLITIEGEPAAPLANAVLRLRGAPGSPVTLAVKRPGKTGLQEFTLTRNIIRVPSVSGARRNADSSWDFMLDDTTKIGWIRLGYIGRESTQEMLDALTDLQARGLRGLVLDLRNNPGGLLDGAVAIADLFVDNGRIVTVKSRKEETAYDAKPAGTFGGFPVALLVNHKTASAAEIVAACLQDHQRAVTIGERTYGQGIVRSIFELKSGVGAVKLPIAAYYRPSGKSMNRYPESKDTDDWGVRPNAGYEVVMTDEELKDYERDRAARDAVGQAAPVLEFQDRPLQKALEYLATQLKTP